MPPRVQTAISQYFAQQPAAVRPVLRCVHGLILKALPEAEEVISYGMPCFKVGGRVAVYMGGWKAHFSLYPASPAVVAALGEEIEAYRASKGTLKFSYDQPVPVALIRRIVKARAEEVEALNHARRMARQAARTPKKGVRTQSLGTARRVVKKKA